MIQVDDIETALASDDLPALEMAFRALIDFPHDATIDGAKSVDTLCRLLGRVTRALQHDQSVMPPAVSMSISQALDHPISTTATYATGAKAVADQAYHWRGRYLQHAATGEGCKDPRQGRSREPRAASAA